MGRCLHLDKRGRQCRGEAGDSPFCRLHGGDSSEDSPGLGFSLRRIVFRLAAALLLLTFLLQAYLLLRTALE